MLSATFVCAILGIGLAAARVDLRRLFAVVAACHVGLLLVLIAQPGFGGLRVAVSLFGVGIGGVHPMSATLMAEAFGSASYGSVAEAMQRVLDPLSIGLLTFIGATHDRTGSYRLAFQVFIGLAFVSAGLVARVDTPRLRARSLRARKVPA